MNMHNNRHVNSFYISLVLYGVSILVIVIYLQYTGNRIATFYAPLIDAAMEIKLEISQSRISYLEAYPGNILRQTQVILIVTCITQNGMLMPCWKGEEIKKESLSQ